jgi:hypothetical protein
MHDANVIVISPREICSLSTHVCGHEAVRTEVETCWADNSQTK